MPPTFTQVSIKTADYPQLRYGRNRKKYHEKKRNERTFCDKPTRSSCVIDIPIWHYQRFIIRTGWHCWEIIPAISSVHFLSGMPIRSDALLFVLTGFSWWILFHLTGQLNLKLNHCRNWETVGKASEKLVKSCWEARETLVEAETSKSGRGRDLSVESFGRTKYDDWRARELGRRKRGLVREKERRNEGANWGKRVVAEQKRGTNACARVGLHACVRPGVCAEKRILPSSCQRTPTQPLALLSNPTAPPVAPFSSPSPCLVLFPVKTAIARSTRWRISISAFRDVRRSICLLRARCFADTWKLRPVGSTATLPSRIYLSLSKKDFMVDDFVMI